MPGGQSADQHLVLWLSRLLPQDRGKTPLREACAGRVLLATDSLGQGWHAPKLSPTSKAWNFIAVSPKIKPREVKSVLVCKCQQVQTWGGALTLSKDMFNPQSGVILWVPCLEVLDYLTPPCDPQAATLGVGHGSTGLLFAGSLPGGLRPRSQMWAIGAVPCEHPGPHTDPQPSLAGCS